MFERERPWSEQYEIPMGDVSKSFFECWRSAGQHLQKCNSEHQLSWLKADPRPPFLEHLSFRLGNQLFFVRLEDSDGQLDVPGNQDGILTIADACNGHPCVMLMKREGTQWKAGAPGWGLFNLWSRVSIDPPSLVTNELIEMTDWELQDFAVQMVRDELRDNGREIMSSNGNPHVNPSLWYVGDDGPEWVVVRPARFPATTANKPRDWEEIADSCARIGEKGHFVIVRVAGGEGNQSATPLWRGHRMFASTNWS